MLRTLCYLTCRVTSVCDLTKVHDRHMAIVTSMSTPVAPKVTYAVSWRFLFEPVCGEWRNSRIAAVKVRNGRFRAAILLGPRSGAAPSWRLPAAK